MLEQSLVLVFFILYLALPRIFVKKKDWEGLIIPFATGVVAALLSAVIETIPSQFIPSFYSSPIEVVLIAPLLEEALKFYGSLKYLKKRRATVSISKSLESGCYLGLGFGMLETLSKTVGAPLYAILQRVLLTMPMHILTASISAYGIGYAFKTERKLYYSLLWLGIAFAIHALFNFYAFHIQL